MPSQAEYPSNRNVTGISVIAAGLVGLPALAQAGSFTPPTTGPYLLAFVTTNTTAATSSDIATYNSFVTSDAALNSALPATTWSAIASTANVDALANIGYASIANDPIYQVDGSEIATSLANFFAGTIINALSETEAGVSAGGYVWTGSNADGTAASGATLGTGTPEFGQVAVTSGGDLASGSFLASTDTFNMYALSAQLGTSVPEPPAAAVLGAGVLAMAAVSRRRRV